MLFQIRRLRVETLEQRIVLDSTVVINEIMYHPATAPEADFEWVELFNQMAINMDISGWSLQGGISYTFPQGTVVPGRGYLVVASNPSALASGTGYGGALGPFSNRLSNSGEEVLLVDNSGRRMSDIVYADQGDWPVGPDGSGFSLAKLDAYSSSSDAASWVTSRQLNGTPGAANFPSGPDPGPALALNEVSAASSTAFWLEIVNQGTTSLPIGGYSVGTSAGAGSSYIIPSQTLAPGQFLALTQAELGFSGAAADKLFLFSPGQDRLLDARVVTDRLQGLAAGHGNDWLYPSAATPGAANSFDLHDEVVINEVMYHAMPHQPTAGTTSTTKLLAIDASTIWRYNEKGTDLGANWAQSAHAVDGTNWFSGAGLLAFETGPLPYPIRTALDDPLATGPGDPFVVTTYFEREFTFSGNLADVDRLLLGHVIDDGAIFYLNGVEVLRFNMPGGTVTAETFSNGAVSDATYVGPISIPKGSLQVGTNRLSVEVHQLATDSTDITFGAELLVSTLAGSSTPFQESDEQWIELYNRGVAAVDLTGWTLADAVEYNFPAGTILPAGGYLVVAKHAAELQARYPSIAIVGDFDKSLSNANDRIRLLAADQNPADELHYYDGGYWPSLADGGGSSLELRDPNADNSQPDAWAASDERNAGTWKTYTYQAVAAADTGPLIWREFLFGMLAAGEVLIDDVSVIANPGTAGATQLIQNGLFQGDSIGAAPQKWRIIGNHHGTVVADPDNAANKVLDLRTTGPAEHEGNNAGTTFVGNTAIVNGVTYEISFRARWVGGSNQLNARFYLARVAHTFDLDVPDDAGTPGTQNSTYSANLGPTYSDLIHGPILPAAGQAVTVSVRADDPDGIVSMTLFWSLDGGAWNSVAMPAGAENLYSGAIPGQSAGKVVQFYVRGQDALGAVSTYPAAGPNSRALYQVNDGQGPSTAIDAIRIIMTTADNASLFVNTDLMSNEVRGATVIYNNQEVFYDVGVRLKGSSWTRGLTIWGGSYTIEFHPDHLFRGVHDEISLDASGSGVGSSSQQRQDEILVKQVFNHAGGGLASNYDDLAYVITREPTHVGTVILQLARYNDVFLDESYVDGAQGNVFEYELVYYETTTVDGNVESLKLFPTQHVVGTPLKDLGSDKEAYRANARIKTNRAEDDYSQFIAMAQAFSLSGANFLNTISGLIDVDQWLRTFAMANLAGVSDSLATGGNQHNIVFYFRPEDGKAVMMPWDWDDCFVLSATSGLVLGSSSLPLAKLMTSPTNAHAYYGHLLDIINTTYNSTYLSSFASQFGGLVGQSFSGDVSYINSRRASVLSQLNAVAPAVPFAVTTNGGNPFTVNATSTTLSGSGWIDVREIRLAGGSQPLPLTWTTPTSWQVTVPLAYGANALTLEAYGFQGNLVGSDSITVTSTATDPRPIDFLRISEIMYHPSASPPGGAFDQEEFEYIELTNIGNATINLAGVELRDGVTFTFPSMDLAPGAFVVVVENATAFASRYTQPITIAGQYSGKLSNSGELITLLDASDQTILSFTFLDDNWYPQTDGDGYSLVIVDPTADVSAWDTQAGWRVSTNLQGSPGAADPLYLDADVNMDGQVDIFDINLVSANWGGSGPAGDANHDAAVNIFDINLISASWGALPGWASAGGGATISTPTLALIADTFEPSGTGIPAAEKSPYQSNRASESSNDFSTSTPSGASGVMQWLRTQASSGPPTEAERHMALRRALQRDVLWPRSDTVPTMARPIEDESLAHANGPAPLHAKSSLHSTVTPALKGTFQRRHAFGGLAALDTRRGEIADRAVVELVDDWIQPTRRVERSRSRS
jgi:Lamin Tail Domain/CotH kinase protein